MARKFRIGDRVLATEDRGVVQQGCVGTIIESLEYTDEVLMVTPDHQLLPDLQVQWDHLNEWWDHMLWYSALSMKEGATCRLSPICECGRGYCLSDDYFCIECRRKYDSG